MKLSVVIPTYNRQTSIVQAVQAYYDSLASQARTLGMAFELIVVDDGSPDDSFRILQNHFAQHPEIQLLRMEKNAGPGPARDAGLARATGEWVWFLDDDDTLDAAGLEHLFSLLLTVREPVDVIAHSLKRTYTGDAQAKRFALGHYVLTFREKQEVFNYVFRRTLCDHGDITFSAGVHEDIRYVFDLIRHARAVEIAPVRVVEKRVTPGAITASMTPARIDGYLQAYHELAQILREEAQSGFLNDNPQAMLDQTLGVILYLIGKVADDAKAVALLLHLKAKEGQGDAWSTDMRAAKAYSAKASNFKYAGSLWRSLNAVDHAALVRLREVFASRLSCKDLDHSLFLAPDEIRGCCKRFFVDGERKGDVVLLKAKEDIHLSDVQAAKDDLISRMNADEAPECSGCPYIERRAVAPVGIDYISLENFSYCNMRCTYCSPKYWGGTEALYNAANIITELTEKDGGLNESCHVVWGGGEPTLSPRFHAVNTALMKLAQVKKIRVLSNSLKYSEKLDALLADARVQLVTSLDAGTQELFQKVRGRGTLAAVLENLHRYSHATEDKRRITVKYILGLENATSDELQAVVGRITEANLLDCLFQISCDFNVEKADVPLVCAMYELAVRLRMAGASHIFFDDLIRDRVRIDDAMASQVLAHLASLQLDLHHVLVPSSEDRVVLWGVGLQSTWYQRRTASGRSGKVLGPVADGAAFQAFAQENACENALIFPSGVQSMYEILRNIEAAGLGDRIDHRMML